MSAKQKCMLAGGLTTLLVGVALVCWATPASGLTFLRLSSEDPPALEAAFDVYALPATDGANARVEVHLPAMLHAADRSFYAAVAERVSLCDIIILEGIGMDPISPPALDRETAHAKIADTTHVDDEQSQSPDEPSQSLDETGRAVDEAIKKFEEAKALTDVAMQKVTEAEAAFRYVAEYEQERKFAHDLGLGFQPDILDQLLPADRVVNVDIGMLEAEGLEEPEGLLSELLFTLSLLKILDLDELEFTRKQFAQVALANHADEGGALAVVRNEYVIRELDRQIQAHPEGIKIAIVYGAAHCSDFVANLERRGLVRLRRDWLKVFSLGE